MIITDENAGRRLDKFLFSYLNNAPHSFIYKMLRKKRIKLNGKRAEGNEILQPDDELKFYLSEETIASCQIKREIPPAPPLTGIIYEDSDLLVVNKPAGLPSQGGMRANDHLLARIQYYLQSRTAAICNRLDVNTSGLVICGKNIPTLQAVNEAFKTREVKKEYLTIVHGNLGEVGLTRTLEGIYKKDEKKNIAGICQIDVLAETSQSGINTALTKFLVLAVSDKYSLLQVSPITGRSHQIRVHLASIGHPPVGDKKYGGSPTPFAKAQLLHCKRLEIPAMGKAWDAPIPKNMSDCINKLFKGAFQ
ncbi:MAG: RluA family pseudouridine synthase [Defluviitaleaceae bacterium]|nr:RluA family pseudouridine synthase [Defluviitaleaceae bacterium]